MCMRQALNKEQRFGSALLSRHQSLEEEFERAKAAVEPRKCTALLLSLSQGRFYAEAIADEEQSDTEFWDKMQAEWEELARRNWLTENEQAQIPTTVSPHEKVTIIRDDTAETGSLWRVNNVGYGSNYTGYYFHTDNPYKDLPNAFEEGLKKSREGDLPNAVLLLEAAVLQDPHDSEVAQAANTHITGSVLGLCCTDSDDGSDDEDDEEEEEEQEEQEQEEVADGLPTPEDVSYGVLVHLPSFPLTCTLLPCRLGKCWEPRRLKMKTSRLPSCPSRGPSSPSANQACFIQPCNGGGQRCLELHPNNLAALMALAVSLTNIGMRSDACEALLRWLRHNPKYKQLLKGKSHLTASPSSQRRMSHAPNLGRNESSLQSEVKELFLEAVQNNSDSIDPDLQTGLGVLYNLSGEFNKAVEAFSTALSARPDDYLLWNRLGATLANGDRSEEAVEAYTRALELQPGFIRSRYNLGISCINLGAHREAASNFLTALSLQRKSRSRQQCQQVMSGNIWAALRIALSMLDQPELFQAANIGDLDLLMRAFNLDI
ncbi:PEX5-related protein PEX2-related protein PEX5-like protein [Takifugu flavidus]|uniref:PEX5-related protein PEX2-related protein PEX5-like protein n=1 Tax=Takifugu flavidus TaxID=433684 RepID=A0A5C6MX23_9TELE|nr:PEX5-related protein PEX2-related protein PEX5-like protein [Takifugu flavidus]